jgi:hypothetical protein
LHYPRRWLQRVEGNADRIALRKILENETDTVVGKAASAADAVIAAGGCPTQV